MNLIMSLFFLISTLCVIVYEIFKLRELSEYVKYLKDKKDKELNFFRMVENNFYILWLILVAFYSFPVFLFVVMFSLLFLQLGFENSKSDNWKRFFVIVDVICSVALYIYFLLTLNF